MAVPVVFNIDPARGPTAGRNLVQVYGDNFRLPDIPDTLPAPDQGPSVQVLFGTADALNVRVARSNRILCEAPISPISSKLVRMAGAPQLTFADANPDTITRDAGDWIADGFYPGMLVRVQGSGSNDGIYRVAGVTALVLTLNAVVSLTAEGPVGGVAVTSRSYGEGVVDVTIRNLDASGNPIVGEEVVVPNAYSYERVQLATASDLLRVCAEMISEVRRQVIPNVSTTTHPDYDATPADLLNRAGLASVPAIVLLGPDTPENRFYSVNGPVDEDIGNGELLVRRAPHTVDIEYTVVVITDSTQELINLQALWMQFVDANPFFAFDRDPDDPSLGQVQYELDFLAGGGPTRRTPEEPSNSALRSFSSLMVLRGFDVEDMTGFQRSRAVDVAPELQDVPGAAPVGITLDQTGSSYRVGPSDGGC